MRVDPRVIVGARFGRLVLQFRNGRTRHNAALWRCVCDCGVKVDVKQGSLVTGATQSCGCLRLESVRASTIARHEKNAETLVGKRYGRLVLCFRSYVDSASKSVWRCVCDCGARVEVRQNNLASGKTRSCGCLKAERDIKHGHAFVGEVSSEYSIWLGMKDRCNNRGGPNFWNYGRRGIRVCEDWQDSFEVFLHDMGPRPSPGHSLERVDNDSGYTPKNCVWATRREQIKNRRIAVMVVYNGQEMWLPEAAELTGLSYKTVRSRMDMDWPEEHWFKPKGFQLRQKPGRPPKTFVTYQGEQLPLAEAARRSGITRYTLTDRIAAGCPKADLFKPGRWR